MRPTVLEFNQSSLVHNLEVLKARAPGQEAFVAIKANGYGHGAIDVARQFESKHVGLAVACFEEAAHLKQAGIQARILVMDGALTEDELAWASEHQVEWVLHSQQQLTWVLKQHKPQHLWVKANTGMNRLGLELSEVKPVMQKLQQCPGVQVSHLMTHFACADEPEHRTHLLQCQRWNQLKQHLLSQYPSLRTSSANSAALWTTPESRNETIRPGIAVYGCSPIDGKTGDELGLKPVMSLKAGLINVRSVSTGESVGYGAEYVAKADSVLGVLAVGYGDGYPRHLRSSPYVWFRNKACPVVGRVSMDMITIDLTGIEAPILGEMAELWGTQIPVEEVAKCAGTIGYELYCGINSHRIERRWVK